LWSVVQQHATRSDNCRRSNTRRRAAHLSHEVSSDESAFLVAVAIAVP
jgi:hypothetical protein